MEKDLEKVFEQQFGNKATASYFAPGRINLIGEHIDYNGGYVFPASISLGTYGLVKKRTDRQFHFYSCNFSDQGVISFSLNDLSYQKKDNWANYPKGMIKLIKEKGHLIDCGLDVVVYGDIPNGAGLSSSASIELLMGVTLCDQFALDISMLELVKIGQQVENHFIGVNSGIMDQFAIGMGKSNHALLLKTDTLDYRLVPAVFDHYVIAIMNTNKQRRLADSKYNQRRAECEQALKSLQMTYSIDTLAELMPDQLEACQKYLPNDVLYQRVRHVVSENQRTLLAEKALKAGDLVAFGQLLNDSHQSLKVDYEVTGVELDTLVAAAQKQPGVLGARMTGAGFGGCAIALVERTQWELFSQSVKAVYYEKIGYQAAIYQAEIGNGPHKIETERK